MSHHEEETPEAQESEETSEATEESESEELSGEDLGEIAGGLGNVGIGMSGSGTF
jgi:hypothetical protein